MRTHLAAMRIPLLVAGLLAMAVPIRLAAQTDYYLRAGVTGWSTLVSDFIAGEVSAKPALAPSLFAGIGHSIAPRYRAGIELAASSGGVRSRYGSTEGDLGSLRTASALALLDGGIAGGLRWQAGLGFLHYFAGGDAGLLASATTRLLVGGGVDFRRPLLSRFDLTIAARYDFHRFTSPALRSHGYSGAQGVQRVSLSVGLARGYR
jgi:hypothetical protein